MEIIPSERLKKLPKYIFARLEEMKKDCTAKGVDVIDLGLGDPDFSSPGNVVESAKHLLDNPVNHHYPSFKGEFRLRKAISQWYKEVYRVNLCPETEVLILLGSKEGLAHLPVAYLNPGDYGLVPDPGYPAYGTAVILAGAIPYTMPLTQENSYMPVLEDIPPQVLEKSKLMYLNYPNNPTAAVANEDFFQEVIDFAKKHDILVCHDFAYSEISFDHIRPVSFMSVAGAKDVGVEFHSFSKTFAMTGWRIGFVVGNKEVLYSLYQVKSCMDSGVFKVVQYAALEALQRGNRDNKAIREEYQERRDIFANGLKKIGWEFILPKATYYFWVKIPGRFASSMEFAEFLLKETGVLVTPGIGFGKMGDVYVRIAINLSIPEIKETLSRLETLSL